MVDKNNPSVSCADSSLYTREPAWHLNLISLITDNLLNIVEMRGIIMKLFVKADAYACKFAAIVTAIADIALIVTGIQDKALYSSLVIAGSLTVLITLLWLLSKREGLLIGNDTLCYISIKKKYYDINQIAGIHIAKAQIHIGTFVNVDVKVKGHYKYKMIYLKDREFEKRSTDDGAYDFWYNHSKHILFTTVYNEQALEYFKSKGISVTGKNQ